MWGANRSGHNEGLVRGQDSGDFDGAFGVVLAADFREVDRVRAVFSEDVIDTEFIGSLSYIPF